MPERTSTTGNSAGSAIQVEGLSIWANSALAALIWGLFGALIAMVSRSAAISIAAGVAYFLIGEQLILHSLWPSTADWLPAGVLDRLRATGRNEGVRDFGPYRTGPQSMSVVLCDLRSLNGLTWPCGHSCC